MDELRSCLRGELREQEPLSRHTSLKVGGCADLFLVPADLADLQGVVAVLDRERVPRFVLGGGYNLLVRDAGVRGAVISLRRLDRLHDSGSCRVAAEAGADNLSLVRFAQGLGLGGIEFLAGVPGSIGGAVSMNAGAYGKAVLERVESLTLLREGKLHEVAAADLDFGYRRLALRTGDIVASVVFSLQPREREEIEAQIRQDLELRRGKHAVGFPSAGSFFKNPPGGAAWKLIDAAGLRGTRVGGAQVSEVHANFLVNAGGATAADFVQLALLVKERVLAATGVLLEEEVRVVGEES